MILDGLALIRSGFNVPIKQQHFLHTLVYMKVLSLLPFYDEVLPTSLKSSFHKSVAPC
jgi:hypothetical protein